MGTLRATDFDQNGLYSTTKGKTMKIEKIILREIHMRLKSPFETSFGVTHDRRIILVEAISDGLTGWGEITVGENPHFNSETTETAWHVINEFIVPELIGKSIHTASDIPQMIAAIRGHQMAKAGVENAFWDIEAQQKNLPLWKLLDGTQPEIACGVSLGIRESPEALVRRGEEERRSGRRALKTKIK